MLTLLFTSVVFIGMTLGGLLPASATLCRQDRLEIQQCQLHHNGSAVSIDWGDGRVATFRKSTMKGQTVYTDKRGVEWRSDDSKQDYIFISDKGEIIHIHKESKAYRIYY